VAKLITEHPLSKDYHNPTSENLTGAFQMLTQARLKEVLHYDPETGIFTRRIRTSTRVNIGDIAGFVHSSGYVHIKIDRKIYKGHRLAWLYMTGNWPYELDHKDGIRSHNWFDNLRDVSKSGNSQNQRKARKDNKNGHLGVSILKKTGTFRACIAINGKNKHLGCFNTADEAYDAYVTAKRIYHPTNTL
jgi:hypothetical protein